MRSTWPLVQGCLILVSLCSMEDFAASAPRDMLEGAVVALSIGELDTVISEDGVNFIGDGVDQVSQELRRHQFPSLVVELSEGEFGCPVHGHKEIELPLFSSDLGNIDVKIADGYFLKAFLAGLSPPTSGSRLMSWR